MAGLKDFLGRAAAGFDNGIDRVTLTSRSPKVALTEAGPSAGTMQVNLHWQTRAPEAVRRTAGDVWRTLLHPTLFQPVPVPTGGGAPLAVDLDLGCMYELTDGSRGVVQPLGELFGNLQQSPFIRLSRDDRTGAPSGETMYIDLAKKDHFRRLLIFVYIYDDTPAFDRAHATVTLFPPGGQPIEVHLDQHAPEARSCAVALIENHGGVLTVRRELRYVYGFQHDLDRLYGFGMQWQRGFKAAEAGRAVPNTIGRPVA